MSTIVCLHYMCKCKPDQYTAQVLLLLSKIQVQNWFYNIFLIIFLKDFLFICFMNNEVVF